MFRISLRVLLVFVPVMGILLGVYGPSLWEILWSVHHPPHQNRSNPMDVYGDGSASSADALLVINALNAGGPRTELSATSKSPPPYCDVNGDDSLTATDVLEIVDFLQQEQAAKAL